MKKTKSGFTITETSISLAFISMLLVAISSLITYCIVLYQKGVTIRNLNDTASALIDDFTRSVTASGNPEIDCDKPFEGHQAQKNACIADSGFGVIYHQNATKVKIKATNTEIENIPTRGIFCTGSFTYIWNAGYVLDENDKYEFESGKKEVFTVSANGGSEFTPRLLRVSDPNYGICYDLAKQSAGAGHEYGNLYDGKQEKVTINITSDSYQDFLNHDSETALAVYDLRIYNRVRHQISGHSLYSGSLTLGTIAGSVDITTADDTCKEIAQSLGNDFSYCAINRFNFAIRAGGR